MSFGGGGFGSGGFGQNNNNNTSSGFGSTGFGGSTGGFGSNNASSGGFGTNTNAGGSIFGSGATGGGFGANNASSGFGAQAKPAFGGSSTTGGLFGSSNTGGGFGSGTSGFGASANTGTGFGASNTNTGGSMFGQKTTSGFGASNTGSGGLFGAGNNTASSGGFGTANTNNNGLFAGNQNASSFANVGEAPGTAGHTFTPFQEKEQNSQVTNHFQSISFMTPFAKHSFEELRLADYAKGQKHGNAGGQTGAFGQSTGFGGGFGTTNNNTTTTGFGGGNTGGGLFGNPATTSSTGFGANTATSGGFGGGLFGQQNKPATTGGAFGTGATTNTNTSGGLFGNSSTTGGFGTATQTQQSGNLFGTNTNANQAKPGGLFGAPANNTTTGFGAGNNSSGGGLFGNPSNQQQQTAPGLFGAPQQNTNPFGGATTNNTTTGGFGGGFGTNNSANNQAKPGGLFGGGTNTSTGLFGNPQQQQGGGFGTNQNQQQSGGLFGNQNQGQTGGGLFANNNTQQKSGLFGAPAANTGGSLFGNNQQQPQQQGSLFGNNQQQAQNTGFGGSLFGNNQQNNQASNSLFGNNQGNNGILGGSQQQQQNPLQGPAGYTASLHDPSPYGSASIFNGLPPPPQNSPGPIATPINGGSLRAKKPAALPQYKLNPSAASRLLTPQKRGYGLSYSTYGTPSSVSSVTSTPGALSSSLLGGSLSRSLGKSLSTSNLRSQLETEPSVLGAGALSGSLRGRESGSLKRLTIDRSLRTDLFGAPQNVPALPAPAPPAPKHTEEPRPSSSLRKRVSFDTAPEQQSGPEADGEPAESQTPTPQNSGFLRSSRGANGRMSMPTQPEMDKVRGNELAIVHEDDTMAATTPGAKSGSNVFNQGEPTPGDYWMKPTLAELKRMTKDELKAVKDFKVGRQSTGFVEFNKPVDLTSTNLDTILDEIVIITRRNLTVYPENGYKPPEGKGLNVPSTITLENCWPRGSDRKTPSLEKVGPRVTKHVERLKKVPGTTFVKYDRDSGEWTFSVPHFTTYGLDDDDEDESELPEPNLGDSVMSEAPPTPTPKGKQVRTTSNPAQEFAPSSSALSSVPSEMMSVDFDDSRVSSTPGDDTFGYRRGKRFPGAFDDTPVFDESDQEDAAMEMIETRRDFNGAASPGSVQSEEEPAELDDAEGSGAALAPTNLGEDIAMAGAFPHLEEEEDITTFGTPVKLIPDLNDDWAERLQHTISPRKNDRYFLKQSQALLDRGDSLLDVDATPTARQQIPSVSNDLSEIKTGVDLMRSLFGKEELRRSGRKADKNGIQWPYKKSDPSNPESKMTHQDKASHAAFKPTFTARNQIILRDDKSASGIDISALDEEPQDYSTVNFSRLVQQTRISDEGGIPVARFEPKSFSHAWGAKDLAHEQETTALQLLHLLFDNYSDEFTKDIPESERAPLRHRIRKDRLAQFWAKLCEPGATRALAEASTHEERALAYLSMHKVSEACDVLAKGKNFRLATLVAQIGGDMTQRSAMQEQDETWIANNVVSEMTDSIRAILALLAGKTSLVDGKKGAIEDKAEAFVLSQRFNMDWKRAFGLRLWYGTRPEDSLEAAVQKYAEDIAAGTELSKPTPWFLDAGSSRISSWKDPMPESRIDLLWAILLLVAEQNQISPSLNLAQALAPENLVGDPNSYRLSFELHLMLAPLMPRAVDDAKADALAVAFSASLEGFGKWQAALWALLFVQDSEQRKHSLQNALSRMTPYLTNETEVNDVLFNKMKIPESWVWDAKALRARAQGDRSSEVIYLARAHKWDEAHRVLCEEVAPLYVIERTHEKLRRILQNFPNRHINDWRLGGQVYEDYLSIVDGKLGGPETRVVLGNLVTALSEIKPRRSEQRKMNFVQSVALSEMTRVATDKANEMSGEEMNGHEAMKLLSLPGSEDLRRQGIAEFGMKHFKAVMTKSM